jgi:hypothetical protein
MRTRVAALILNNASCNFRISYSPLRVLLLLSDAALGGVRSG